MNRPSRRDLLTAFGATGLVGVAAAGFAKPDARAASSAPPPGGRDDRLLALCAAFMAVHRELEHHNGDDEDDEAVTDEIVRRWDEKLALVTKAAPPKTHAGHRAFMEVARVAFMDQVIGGYTRGHASPEAAFRANSSPEDRIVMKALLLADRELAA